MASITVYTARRTPPTDMQTDSNRVLAWRLATEEIKAAPDARKPHMWLLAVPILRVTCYME